MKIAVIVIRVLLGVLFLFASISYFLGLMPQPELQGNHKIFNEGLKASGYILPLAKTIEFLAGISLVSGFFLPFALILLAPITVNIVCIHIFMAPQGLPMAAMVLFAHLFLAYTQKDLYIPLFKSKL